MNYTCLWSFYMSSIEIKEKSKAVDADSSKQQNGKDGAQQKDQSNAQHVVPATDMNVKGGFGGRDYKVNPIEIM